jgi:hypothetical protein
MARQVGFEERAQFPDPATRKWTSVWMLEWNQGAAKKPS